MSTPRTAWPVRGRPVGRSLVHTGLAACWYPAVLLAGTTLLNDQPSDRQRQWVAWLSTDLHNLSTHPVGSMIGSALVCQGDLAAWMLLALVGLAGLGARIGAWAAAGLVAAVHVAATLVSQSVVAGRIAAGQVPAADRVMTDVGPSYLVVAALIGALFYAPPLGRVPAAVGFAVVAPSLVAGLSRWEVSSMGHAASVVLAVAFGAVATRRSGTPRWQRPAREERN